MQRNQGNDPHRLEATLDQARELGARDGAVLGADGRALLGADGACAAVCAEQLQELRARGVLALDAWAAAYTTACCQACEAERAQVRRLELDHGMVVEGVHCRVLDPPEPDALEARLRFSLGPLLRAALWPWGLAHGLAF